MATNRSKNRIYWRSRGDKRRAYGDFRDFADVGGGREALISEGSRSATTDPEWGKMTQIVDASEDGKPYRVVIECQDPQDVDTDHDICEGEREIAVQDLFQVYRCEPCQKRAVNRRRRERRKEKAAAQS